MTYDVTHDEEDAIRERVSNLVNYLDAIKEPPRLMPTQAPPVIRSGLPRWEVRDGKLCEVVRTDRCFREVKPGPPVRR